MPAVSIVSITLIGSVYCAVRTGYLNIQSNQRVSVHLMIIIQSSGAQRRFDYPVFQVKSFFKFGHTMDQEITYRLALDRLGFGHRLNRVSFVVRFSSEHYSFPLS
jgi:hypothetical protein